MADKLTDERPVWIVGSAYPCTVSEACGFGRRPVAEFFDERDAQRAVTAVNALRASEERVKSLTSELAVTRDALLLAVRRENDCIDAECVRGDWDSPACFCASEARDMVSTLTAPDKGETPPASPPETEKTI